MPGFSQVSEGVRVLSVSVSVTWTESFVGVE